MKNLAVNAQKIVNSVNNVAQGNYFYSIEIEGETIEKVPYNNEIVKASRISKIVNLVTTYHKGINHKVLKSKCKFILSDENGNEIVIPFIAGKFNTRVNTLLDKLVYNETKSYAFNVDSLSKAKVKMFYSQFTDLLLKNMTFVEIIVVLSVINKFDTSDLIGISDCIEPIKDNDLIIGLELTSDAKKLLD